YSVLPQQAPLKGERASRCPLWVKSRHVQRTSSCPLYPRKRHQMRHSGMSAKADISQRALFGTARDAKGIPLLVTFSPDFERRVPPPSSKTDERKGTRCEAALICFGTSCT